MDRLAEIEAFVCTADLGSQAAAADALGLSRMAVSRLLRQLETRMGVPLLYRTTRRQTLTEAGARFLAEARTLVERYGDLTSATKTPEGGISGTLRISAPVSFGSRHVMPLLPAFAALYPRVLFDVVLSDRQVHLTDEGFDLALRITADGGSAVRGTRLATARTIICAAPAYVAARGMPLAPADLSQHNCLRYAYSAETNTWPLVDASGAVTRVEPQGNLVCNNGDALLAAAIAGQGIIQQPAFIVAPEIRAGRLMRLLGQYRTRELTISAVYAPAARPQAKILTFIDFLVDRYAGESF
ncbi:LysR family transcriptional regulator [Phreatobacter sp.]|uniref:LysR family transcriptional regulator n=1 Tax=Phreatobacter sp. TaxID=1966341 RepID=UPI0022C5D1AB|nr:LysR family transcriptional regulator [Phreatobacter sp.]MCZ8314310.1 LysR family transcriptional regulator [Phreatobacter sp.]